MQILFALHNGHLTNTVALANRGLAYGDGLFETIKIVGGRAQFLSEHLQRLQRDCARLHIVLDLTSLKNELMSLLREQRDGVLKIVITRGAGARGYAPTSAIAAERLLLFYPQLFNDDENARHGVAVRLCRQRLAEQAALAGIKHLNRLEQVLARAEQSDGTTGTTVEGLMLDMAGRLIEGTMSNIFLVRDRKVYTPRLHRCGVAGVMREIILNRLAPRCAPIIEADLVLDDLYAANEVFLSNSLIGIWPVRKIECLHKTIGDVTLDFQYALARLVDETSAVDKKA